MSDTMDLMWGREPADDRVVDHQRASGEDLDARVLHHSWLDGMAHEHFFALWPFLRFLAPACPRWVLHVESVLIRADTGQAVRHCCGLIDRGQLPQAMILDLDELFQRGTSWPLESLFARHGVPLTLHGGSSPMGSQANSLMSCVFQGCCLAPEGGTPAYWTVTPSPGEQAEDGQREREKGGDQR